MSRCHADCLLKNTPKHIRYNDQERKNLTWANPEIARWGAKPSGLLWSTVRAKKKIKKIKKKNHLYERSSQTLSQPETKKKSKSKPKTKTKKKNHFKRRLDYKNTFRISLKYLKMYSIRVFFLFFFCKVMLRHLSL